MDLDICEVEEDEEEEAEVGDRIDRMMGKASLAKNYIVSN